MQTCFSSPMIKTYINENFPLTSRSTFILTCQHRHTNLWYRGWRILIKIAAVFRNNLLRKWTSLHHLVLSCTIHWPTGTASRRYARNYTWGFCRLSSWSFRQAKIAFKKFGQFFYKSRVQSAEKWSILRHFIYALWFVHLGNHIPERPPTTGIKSLKRLVCKTALKFLVIA